MSEADETAVRRTYDEVADTYADHFRSTEPEAPIDLAMIGHFVTLLAPPRVVLDAGCGAGRMMPVLAGLGCRVEGIDLSAGMVRRARVDHPQFGSQVASLAALPYGDATFDGVFSWYSTVHSTDDALPVIFGEALRVLRPDGLLLVAFQTGDGVRDVGQAFRDRGHDVVLQRHHRSVARVGEMLETTGFATVASLDRAAQRDERDGQGVIIAGVL